MTNKTIVFTAPCIAELLDKPMPEPKAHEVLIRSVRDTISAGTERANLIGDPNVSPVVGQKVVFPRQCGYSIAGIVEAVGEGVTKVKVGDKVSCAWTKHAKYNLLNERNVYPLSDSVSLDEAALVHL